MHNPQIFYIWYGPWAADDPARTILTDLANSLGGSTWWNIQTTYYDESGPDGGMSNCSDSIGERVGSREC